MLATWILYKAEVISVTKGKKDIKDLKQEEFATDLSPDDLDVREENERTSEQVNNANKAKDQQEKIRNKNNEKEAYSGHDQCPFKEHNKAKSVRLIGVNLTLFLFCPILKWLMQIKNFNLFLDS